MDAEPQSNSTAAPPVEEVPRGTDPGTASFYIHKDEVMYGPDTAVNLRLLCQAGWLRPDDLVWEEGAPEWLAAGVVFASFFPATTRQQHGAPVVDREADPDDFFQAAAVRFSAEKSWPWGSLGIAIVAHIALLLLVVALFQFFPFTIVPYASPPQTEAPPLEVAMVTEPEPAPPPPPTPPDPTPPPPNLPPPPPVPTFASTDLPPPPPAPAEMPLPSVPLPTLPTEPMLPDEMTPAVHPPAPHPHHVAKASVAATRPVAVQEAPPPENAGPPEYLADPRPVYPYAARMRHQEGTVLLLVTLDQAGNPTSVSIEQSSGSGVLDEAARTKVAADWRFKPGQGSTVHVPVEFHLENE